MNILIRTDISAEHGMGHATRCLALAKALQVRGACVAFITATPALRAFVAPLECICPTDTSQECLFSSILGHEPDIVVFDTKALFDEEWYPLIKMGCGCPEPANHKTTIDIVRIDHPHATSDTCDLLIGPCAHWSPETVQRLTYSFGERFLYGWDYVMLDEDVTSHVPIPYQSRSDAPIIFCAGGSDPGHALEQMWRWAEHLLPEQDKIFLVGQYATEHTMAQGRNRRHITSFSRVFLRVASLFIGMLGQTTYECIYYQTPMLCCARTHEDSLCLRRLSIASASAVEWFGHIANIKPSVFCDTIASYWHNPSERQRMHNASAGLIDGKGIARIAEAVLRLGD